jgi:hypothetical protein
MTTTYSKHFSSLWTNLFFTVVQVYGLLFMNWSGLYVVYLYWIELAGLSLFSGIRYWQTIRNKNIRGINEHMVSPFDEDKLHYNFQLFVFVRVVFLALFLLLIGFSAVPYEHYQEEVKSTNEFFANLAITDPVFLFAAFFIVFYYLKLIFSKMDFSPLGLVELSFNFSPMDPRMLSPLIALLVIPIIGAFYYNAEIEIENEAASKLYVFAILFLAVKTYIDVHFLFIVKNEMKKRGLI